MILLAFALYTLDLQPLSEVTISERAFESKAECIEYVETLLQVSQLVNPATGAFTVKTEDNQVIAGACLTQQEYMAIIEN